MVIGHIFFSPTNIILPSTKKEKGDKEMTATRYQYSGGAATK